MKDGTAAVHASTVREFMHIITAQAKAALNGVAMPGVLQISRLHPTDEKLVPSRYMLDDVERMIGDAVAGSEAGHNVYLEGRTIRADTARGHARGTLADTAAVFALIVDSDADKGMGWNPTVRVSMTVATSPGNFQYWFFLREAVNAEIGKTLGERIRKAVKSDHDTGNPVQPYRVAGTVNYPSKTKIERGRVTVPTQLIEFDPEALWTPEEIEAAFPERKPEEGGGDEQPADESGIPAETLDAIRSTQKGGRGQVFWNVILVLKQLGWTVDGIVTVFEKYPDGIASKYRGRLRREVERVYKKIEIKDPAEKPDEALPYVDLAADLKPREWLVPERIPMRNVSMLGGEGAIGKSLLLMQLSASTVLGKDWIGTLPEPGPVLYMSCEEDDDEVRRRMEDVARYFGSSRKEMIERGLRFLSFAGRDAILAQPNRAGIMQPTLLLDCLCREANALHPKLIAIDTVADTFGGKENDRAQTRQFITMLRGLAIASGAAVVMLAHPSLTGIATDTGLSGNTGWHNSVRARMYLKAAPGDDASLRVLEVKKNNYGPVQETIVLRWRDGVYVVEPGKGTFERLAAEAEVEQLFIKLLRRFTEQGRNVSDKKSPTHAPTLFADEPEAKAAKVSKKDFNEAMARLFALNKLRVVTVGSASRMRSRIVEVGGEEREPATILPFPTPLPTPFQHPSNGVLAHTPHTPHPVGRANGGVGSPPGPPNRDSAYGRLASVLRGWPELFGFGSFVSLPLLVNHLMSMDPDNWPDQPNMRAMQSALREVAEVEPGRIDSARLEQWLCAMCGIEVGHFTLRDAGEKDGARGWTLSLRVEPDKGSPSL